MYKYLVLFFVLFTLACSQYSEKASSRRWHSFNAKYNAYLQAKDNLLIAEKQIISEYKDNYSEPLPILIPLDTNTAKVASKELEAVIKKASLIAEKHSNSKWIGAAYNLIGRARLYKGDYINAIETFKYVNSEATQEVHKHEALTNLMRAYLESGDESTALRVGEVLAQLDMNKENTKNFYLTKAHIHQKLGETKLAASILSEALPMMKKGPEKARLHFVAGQLYEKLNQTFLAGTNYKAVLKNKPSYDLAFYSELNKMMFAAGGDLKATFLKLSKDRKNIDLLDKLYYSMALIEEKAGNVTGALDYLQKATKAQTQGKANIANAYLKMGDIYYFRQQDYEKSKAYYDSAMSLLSTNSTDYEKIADRKRALDDYSAQMTIIRTEDSLQRMAAMTSEALDEFLDESIKKNIEQEKKAMEAAKKANEIQAKTQQLQQQQLTAMSDPSSRWYFYNEDAMMKGRIEFTQRWGAQRKLEDNWRRSIKETQSFAAFDNKVNDETKKETDTTADEDNADRIAETVKLIKDKLPKTPEALAASKAKQAAAYFNLAKIYKIYLLENDNAIKYFEKHLAVSPKSDQTPEALYYLVLLYEGKPEQDQYKNQLLQNYPTSYYSRKLNKGTENLSKTDEIKALELYETAYKSYSESKYTDAVAKVDEGLAAFPGSNFEDRFAFLKILILAKNQNKIQYELALEEFLQTYNKSSLLSLAKEMKTVLKPVEKDLD